MCFDIKFGADTASVKSKFSITIQTFNMPPDSIQLRNRSYGLICIPVFPNTLTKYAGLIAPTNGQAIYPWTIGRVFFKVSAVIKASSFAALATLTTTSYLFLADSICSTVCKFLSAFSNCTVHVNIHGLGVDIDCQ